jgi:hypothetical protein
MYSNYQGNNYLLIMILQKIHGIDLVYVIDCQSTGKLQINSKFINERPLIY